jgi:hypothetical protein
MLEGEPNMIEPTTYTLSYGATKLNLILTDDRFVSKGSMQNVDIPLSALRHFCVVPSKSNAGAYDSELVVSWDELGKAKSRKIYVRCSEVSFKQFLSTLEQKRPDASLLSLSPAAAQKAMGVTSTNKIAWIVALAIVGIILLAVVIVGLSN